VEEVVVGDTPTTVVLEVVVVDVVVVDVVLVTVVVVGGGRQISRP
jgi:hypothetical protein